MATTVCAYFSSHLPSAPPGTSGSARGRDRGVDESGNQLVVFGRRGGRPFNHEEMQRMYMRDGKVFTVTDGPPEGGKEIAFREVAARPAAAEAPAAPKAERPARE